MTISIQYNYDRQSLEGYIDDREMCSINRVETLSDNDEKWVVCSSICSASLEYGSLITEIWYRARHIDCLLEKLESVADHKMSQEDISSTIGRINKLLNDKWTYDEIFSYVRWSAEVIWLKVSAEVCLRRMENARRNVLLRKGELDGSQVSEK